MKASDIIRRLMEVLPIHTDKFTDNIDISSITSSGLLATVTTSAPHGLTTGKYAHISGALVPNTITSLTQVDGIASAVTTSDHDLTLGYQENIIITGAAEAKYNGEHKLVNVFNRREFTFEVDETAVSPDTGTPLLLEDLKAFNYNGWHDIVVTSPTEFTYVLEKSLGSPAYGEISGKITPRISGVATLEEAYLSYTKQSVGELFAYVVLEDLVVSKDRNESTDATARFGKFAEYRQVFIQQFHVYVFYPNTQNISARSPRDDAEDLIFPLCKSLLGVRFPSGFVEAPYSGVVFVSNAFGNSSNKAIYVNDFVFESSGEIQTADIAEDDRSVAFRDIDAEYRSSLTDDDIVKMTGVINLDNEPL
jgi:hypothetical protein